MQTRSKIAIAVALGLIAAAGIVYKVGKGPEFKPSPVVVAPSPAPTLEPIVAPTAEPTVEPQSKITASAKGSTIKVASVTSPTWDYPTADLTAKMTIPSNVYRVVQSFVPPSTYSTGLENFGGYQMCSGAEGNPVSLPCAYVFLPQQIRWILMAACPSGVKPGSPPQCFCANGYRGNSGKCS
jgi:hypothetical protein